MSGGVFDALGKPAATAALAGCLLMSLAVAMDVESMRAEDLDLDLSNAEPTVTIKRRHNHIAEEFRVNNNLYMIKITPNVGPSYFLVDPDGDGAMGWRRDVPGMDITPPQWALLSW
jgi:hypothetical protein